MDLEYLYVPVVLALLGVFGWFLLRSRSRPKRDRLGEGEAIKVDYEE